MSNPKELETALKAALEYYISLNKYDVEIIYRPQPDKVSGLIGTIKVKDPAHNWINVVSVCTYAYILDTKKQRSNPKHSFFVMSLWYNPMKAQNFSIKILKNSQGNAVDRIAVDTYEELLKLIDYVLTYDLKDVIEFYLIEAERLRNAQYAEIDYCSGVGRNCHYSDSYLHGIDLNKYLEWKNGCIFYN